MNIEKQTVQVEYVDIADLGTDPNNANKHTEAGSQLLYKSINELGFGRSTVVDTKNVLIAGNGVKEQALKAGKTKAMIVDLPADTLLVARRLDLELGGEGEAGRMAAQMGLIDNSSALAGINFDNEIVTEIGEDWNFDPADWGVDTAIVHGKPVEMDCVLDFAQEMGIGKEYLLIVFQDNEQYETAVEKLALKKVVEKNLAKRHLNNKGIERVLFFNDFKKRYENSSSIV